MICRDTALSEKPALGGGRKGGASHSVYSCTHRVCVCACVFEKDPNTAASPGKQHYRDRKKESKKRETEIGQFLSL